jgi:hypothetical protein
MGKKNGGGGVGPRRLNAPPLYLQPADAAGMEFVHSHPNSKESKKRDSPHSRKE